MSPEMKQRWDEHLYQMEKCSFLLDVIRAHVSVILTTDAHSGSMLDACVILGGVSPQYCDFILKTREKFPDHDLEMLSQEIYDRIFSRDFKSTARFQQFFEKPLEQWYIVRKQARDLRDGLLDRDEAIANFKHAYYMQFETDVDVVERPEKPEQKKQEEEPKTEPETEEEPYDYFRKETEARLLCRMYKEGAISEEIVVEYLDLADESHDTFLRIVDIYAGQAKEEKQDE